MRAASLSYGPDLNNQFRRAAFYVDRIFKGETRRASGAAAHEGRTRHQSQDRKGARPHNADDHANDRRRGNRIGASCWSAHDRLWPIPALSARADLVANG